MNILVEKYLNEDSNLWVRVKNPSAMENRYVRTFKNGIIMRITIDVKSTVKGACIDKNGNVLARLKPIKFESHEKAFEYAEKEFKKFIK